MSNQNLNLSLKKFNTFGIDVSAKNIIYLTELKQLDHISNLEDCFIIGGGSNILLTKSINKPVIINQTKGIFVNDTVTPEVFTKQIAFNAIPHIDVFMDDGFTKEEWKMQVETAKILDPNIKLVAHCVRIPVFIGHSEAVFIETEKSFEEKQIRELLRNAEGLAVIDMRSDEGYATPVECAGDDLVFVSRIRKDITVENGLVFWCVSDNLRKGAALNSVQIAELAVAQKYF